MFTNNSHKSSTKPDLFSKEDLFAAFSVALVALPLSLGIASACSFSPIAGIISAVCGGIIGALLGGGPVSIKGPGAGLIGVTLVALASLGSIEKVLAATVVAGVLMSFVGYFKLAKFVEQLPSSVIGGFLAAIGIIILSKELFFGWTGNTTLEGAPLKVLWSIKDHKVHSLNAFLFLTALFVLLFSQRILPGYLKKIPAPIWVVISSLPFVFTFELWKPQTISFLGQACTTGPQLLVELPQNIRSSLLFPDFSALYTFDFWNMAFSIAVVALITSLTCAKAVDKIDLEKRKTNLNKDIFAVGVATMVSAALGGLAVITVIVRSSVNIQNGAKTKYSNLFHGIIILLMLFILTPFIRLIPRAALSAILVYTGLKLAAPSIFQKAIKRGNDQLFILCATLFITLISNQIIGVIAGIIATLVGQLWRLRHQAIYRHRRWKSGKIKLIKEEDIYCLWCTGWVNFMKINQLERLLKSLPNRAILQIDVSEVLLMDSTLLECIEDFLKKSPDRSIDVSWIGRQQQGSAVVGLSPPINS